MRLHIMKSVFCIFSAILQLLLDVHGIEVATQIPEEIASRIPQAAKLLNDTRRIINGIPVVDNRPYMVHLKLPRSNEKSHNYRKWLCGGVIVHEEYILTSAACIEDVKHFYVVSGTYKYADEDDIYTNPCIKNGAKKAIWKCVPKNYIFDGHENDNIRWMSNDIAVVKIEDGFDFTRRIRGCEFVPKPICYNNHSVALENPGNLCTVAGWGTTERYNDWVNRRMDARRTENQQNLLEAVVEIISKNRCKHRWGARYHNIIDNYMICTKDIGETMSDICNEKYVDCQQITYYDEEDARRNDKVNVPVNLVMHSALHNETYANGTRRHTNTIDGGFCENDHGGPLVYGTGIDAVVIGIISACLVKERTNKCYGPFLYTSVYKNKQLISCSIYKDIEPSCRRQYRSGVTHVEHVLSWKDHPEGPAKFEKQPSKKEKAPLPARVAQNAAETKVSKPLQSKPLEPKPHEPKPLERKPVEQKPVNPKRAPKMARGPAPKVAQNSAPKVARGQGQKPTRVSQRVVKDKMYPNRGFVMRAVNDAPPEATTRAA